MTRPVFVAALAERQPDQPGDVVVAIDGTRHEVLAVDLGRDEPADAGIARVRLDGPAGPFTIRVHDDAVCWVEEATHAA